MERKPDKGLARERPTLAVTRQSRSLTSDSHPLLRLQRRVGNRATGQLLGVFADPEAASGFPEILAASRGQGQPLPSDVRTDMEAHFHADFSPVRVHDDDNATRLARAADAVAFTSGTDVYLGADAPRTARGPGWALLVHELAHVVQQARGPVQASPSALGVMVSDPDSAEEQEAAVAAGTSAAAVAAGTRAETVSPARAPDSAGRTAGPSQREATGRSVVWERPIQRQRPRGRNSASVVTTGEPTIEHVGWEGGAPGGAGTSPTEQVGVMSGEIPAPFRYETEEAAQWLPLLPIVYNSFVLPAAPFTRAYARVLDYQAIGVPLDPAALPASIMRILSLRDAPPSEAREVHEATERMASPDSNVQAAYRRVEAFQSHLLMFGQRLEEARTKISEFEARQDIRREQAALDEVRATKALVEQLLGAAASLIGLAGGLAGAFGSEAVGTKAAGTAGGLAAGGEVLQLVTWPFFHSEITKYEQGIDKLEKKQLDLEKQGLTLELGIAQLDLGAVAKEMEAQKIDFEQAVLARRQQAATLGTALEAAHPRSARGIGSGTITAVIGMANAVHEAAFFAHETLVQLESVELEKFIRRAQVFGYIPADDSPVHRDKKRMLVGVATLFAYKDVLLSDEPVLARMARAWKKILAVPTGGPGSY